MNTELIAAAQQGDQDACDRLVRENTGLIWSIVRRYYGRGAEPEDLYQLVSGTLRGGDRIHIYTVDEEIGQAYLTWDNVMVYQAFDSSGSLIPPQDTVSAATRINVLLEEGNAELFYSELYRGSLRVVKLWE